MSDNPPTDEVSAFFRNLREQVGIDFEDEGEDAPVERAREMADDTPPEPPLPEPEEAEEAETYPGSKQALKRIEEDELDDEIQKAARVIPWDDLPVRTYTLQGKSTEFYTIGSLAKALRREVVTLRKWEQKGYLPPAPYRSPGEGTKKDRLYTRDHVEGLVKILSEEKLLNPRKKMRIDQTNFPAKAHRLFAKLGNREEN